MKKVLKLFRHPSLSQLFSDFKIVKKIILLNNLKIEEINDISKIDSKYIKRIN